MSLFYVIVIASSIVATIVLSIVIGSILSNKKMKRNVEDADDRAKLIIKEAEIAAENLKKDRILEAKEKRT